LRKLGFAGPFAGKKHQHLIRGNTLVIIPNPHHGQDIGADLIGEILRKAKITREEWFSAA
jgi:hypothetical protein